MIGAGPETYLPRTRVRVLEDSLVGGIRHLRLVIRSDLKGEMVGVFLPHGEAVITGLEGIPLGQAIGPVPVQRLSHWGEPEAETVTFGLQTPENLVFLELQILEHHLRPWEILGEGFFGRDKTLIPNPQVGSDRIVQRTWVVVPLGEEGCVLLGSSRRRRTGGRPRGLFFYPARDSGATLRCRLPTKSESRVPLESHRIGGFRHFCL